MADLIELLAKLNTMRLPTDPEASDFARTVVETLERMHFEKADLHEVPVGSQEDGGPARVASLRDYFAGQALAGLATGLNIDAIKALAHERAVTPTEAAARIAYDFADAMLKVRG